MMLLFFLYLESFSKAKKKDSLSSSGGVNSYVFLKHLQKTW